MPVLCWKFVFLFCGRVGGCVGVGRMRNKIEQWEFRFFFNYKSK